MRIGLIADIHGNRPALEAVLGDAPDVASWVCLGDVVGYYPDVNEVCGILAEIGAQVIRGNHDAYVTGELLPDGAKRPLYRTDWTRERLRPENLRWLAGLPVELRFSFEARCFRVRHASPWDEETYLYPDSPRLPEIELGSEESLLIGHTHRPMIVRAGEGRVINPGSVGQSRDGNSDASYAVLDTRTGVAQAHRARYDVAAYQAQLRALEWPGYVINALSGSRQADSHAPGPDG